MPQNTQQERGHLYRAEKPDFPKGSTGKGVSIGGSVTSKQGTPLQIGDNSAKNLRKEWSRAKNSNGRFPPF